MLEPEYEAYTLCSGSKGNSVYIRSGNTRILLDAGMSAKAAENALSKLGTSLSLINCIFITHEHTDHTKGVAVISKKFHIPIHVTAPSAPYISCSEECLSVHMPDFKCIVGSLEIRSFITPHDSKCSVGYTVSGGGHVLGLATDLGFMPDSILERLTACDSVILESNHDETMLEKGSYPRSLKDRILSDYGHLSNRTCAKTAATLAENGVRRIVLAHLSEENNLPRLALVTTSAELAMHGISRTSVDVARQDIPVKVI